MASAPPIPSKLRAYAEGVLAHAPRPEGPARSAEEVLHELQVYQIELEMQNESLRQAQIALEESRDRYADLYEFAPIGYLTLDQSGRITDANLTGAALLGEDRGKLRLLHFEDFVAAEDRQGWRNALPNLLCQDGKSSLELRLQHKDGTLAEVHLDCLPRRNGANTLRIALSDITLHKQALTKVQASEDRLRLAKTATNLGIFDVDPVHDTTEWDQQVRNIWGIGPDEPADYAKFMAGVHPDDRAATRAALDLAFDPLGTGEYHNEYRVISRDGSLHQVSAIGRAYFERGQLTRFVGTIKDVSREKQLEREEQERRNEMDLLVKQQVAVQTAAAIAHELNQPLVSISAYSEAALRMLKGGAKNPEKLAHALAGAAEQAQRAGRTLLELLDFLHKGEAPMVPVDLNELVAEALAIAAESGYGEFRPVLQLEPGLRPVLANRLQLQKVLVILLHNGVEAMREAGVPAAAITISVRTFSGGNIAQVTVQDSGPGITGEAAQRIFEPFFTTKPKGMGLGLAISRALIQAHGGQLWLDLDSGPGATFHFTLPFA
ncbi:MAG: PAS domain S-box protein [Rhodocyclaceae bacterium]|nr:PAS domain S-box protein [Rhodocyclaceae bacterium]